MKSQTLLVLQKVFFYLFIGHFIEFLWRCVFEFQPSVKETKRVLSGPGPKGTKAVATLASIQKYLHLGITHGSSLFGAFELYIRTFSCISLLVDETLHE